MFIAGTNGPASVLEWSLAELVRNPHVFKKAREEIESVVGKERLCHGGNTTPSFLCGLHADDHSLDSS